MNKAEYREYLLSYKWRDIARQIRARSGGWCERCHSSLAAHVHHLTYERVGNEELDEKTLVSARAAEMGGTYYCTLCVGEDGGCFYFTP